MLFLPPRLKITQQKKLQVTFLIQVTVSPQSRSWTAIPAMLNVCSGYKLVKLALPQREVSKMT